jgi:hypothetical protein
MTPSYPLASSSLSTRPAESPRFLRKKKHHRSAAKLGPRSSRRLTGAEVACAHLVLATARGEARPHNLRRLAGAEAAHAHLVLAAARGEARPRAAHGSPSGGRLHTSRAPPAQFAMAGAELAHTLLAMARIELAHAQLEAELTPRIGRAPPAQCGDPPQPSPPDLT